MAGPSIGDVSVGVDLDTSGNTAEARAGGLKDGLSYGRGFRQGAKLAMDRFNKDMFKDKDKDDQEAEDAGRDRSKAFWKGANDENDKGGSRFGKSLKFQLAKWGAIIGSFGETVGVALFGAAGVILELGASLLQAASAGAALVPVAVGLAAAFGAVFIGIQGVPDALTAVNEGFAEAVKEGKKFSTNTDEIKEALAGLHPAAAEFVLAFANIRTALSDMQGLVQGALFTGLSTALNELTFTQLPSFQAAMVNMAGAVSTFVQDFVDGINKGTPIGEILNNLVPIIANVLGALTPLATAFLSFVQTATPFAAELATQFRLWADNMADFVTSAEGTEAIQGFLDRALDSLQSWFDLIGATGRLIGTLMEDAGSRGDGLIDSLTNIVNSLNDWLNTDSGRDAFLTFLDDSERIIKALAPVVEGLGGFIDAMVTPGGITRFEDLADTLGEILPILGKILGITSEAGLLNVFADAILAIGEAMEDTGLITALTRLSGVIGRSLGNVLQAIIDSGILDMLARGLTVIAQAVSKVLAEFFSNEELLTAFSEGLAAIGETILLLIPVFLQLLPLLTATLPAFISILDILPPLAELIVALMPAINFVTDALVLWLTVQMEVMNFITVVVFTVIETLIGWLTSLVEILTGAVNSAIEGLSSAWEATTKDISEFWDRNVAPVIEKIGEFATFIGTKFREAKDAVVKAWDELFQGVKDTTDDIKRIVSDAWQTISDTAAEMWGAIRDAITGTWDDLVSAFEDTVEDIQDFWDDLVSFVEEIPDKFGEALSDVAKIISKPFEDAYNKVKEWIDKIKNLPASIGEGFKNLASKVPGAGLIGLAAGGIVYGPQRRLIGEAGPEAVIPLSRPLAMVDPSVRAMAALIRGDSAARPSGSQSAPTAGAGMVNNWTINEVGNGEATAQKVINRLLANVA